MSYLKSGTRLTAMVVAYYISLSVSEEYIGQTGRLLKERLVLYRQHINSLQYQTSYCEQHLRNCGKGKFTIFPFFQLKNDNRSNRENHESKFIHKFKPTLNRRL